MTDREVINEFHRIYYEQPDRTFNNTRWLGVAAQKYPSDLWVYQEIVWELRPDVIVETGTNWGGSALFLASVCELIGHGKVVTIDLADMAPSRTTRPQHERITYLSGSSTSPEVVAEVRGIVDGAETVMVILDSNHTRDHVVTELKIYGELVTTGSYLIVEDTNVNGHPVFPAHGDGPMEAVDLFLRETRDFAPDRSREKYLVTASPKGFLKRVEDGGAEARLLDAEVAAHELERQAGDKDQMIAELLTRTAELESTLAEVVRVSEARAHHIEDLENRLSGQQR